MKKEIQYHWHLLYIELGKIKRSYLLPSWDIRKDSFDLLWLGLQITWRYYGNYKDYKTGIRVKDE